MFGWPKKKTAPASAPNIRDTLFGDMSLDAWIPASANGEPWLSFIAARTALEQEKPGDAIDGLTRIVNMPNLEARHYVQAWYFLRQLGSMPPPAMAQAVYGVVVEVGMDQGLDMLAAYADGSARYYNSSGSAVIWERPDDSFDQAIHNVLNAARNIMGKIGPWDKGRPAPPPKGHVRINIFTPLGLHFGQGAFNVLSADAIGGPILSAATILMHGLLEKASANRKK